MDAIATLKELALFAQLGEEELALLAGQVVNQRFEEGAVIFRRGDPGGGMFVVLEGRVELFVTNTTGERLVLETVEPKGYFGELSLLDGQARSAEAVCVEPTTLFRLDRDHLEELFTRHPSAAFEVLSEVTRRLRQTDALLRHGPPRSPNETIEEKATPFQRFADWLAYVSGTLPFLLLHVAWFGAWVLINNGLLPVGEPFDPFPFGLLTMVVSLEAIFLSCVVLISQNRQAARDRIRSDAEYQANIRSAVEVTQLHVKLDAFEQMVIGRLDHLTRDACAPRLAGQPRPPSQPSVKAPGA